MWVFPSFQGNHRKFLSLFVHRRWPGNQTLCCSGFPSVQPFLGWNQDLFFPSLGKRVGCFDSSKHMVPLPADSRLAVPGQMMGSAHSRQLSSRTRSAAGQGRAFRELSHGHSIICSCKWLQYVLHIFYPQTGSVTISPLFWVIENYRFEHPGQCAFLPPWLCNSSSPVTSVSQSGPRLEAPLQLSLWNHLLSAGNSDVCASS